MYFWLFCWLVFLRLEIRENDLSTIRCIFPLRYFTENQGDCDDLISTCNPSAQELRDGIDNDCNELVDDNVLISNILL